MQHLMLHVVLVSLTVGDEVTGSDIATPRVSMAGIEPVTESTGTHVGSKSNLYDLLINGIHFDTSLASTLANCTRHSIQPGMPIAR